MNEIGNYRVNMDRDWTLQDLCDFPRAYNQAYSFAYCFGQELPDENREKIDSALYTYNWKGGYSYVNIFTVLQNQVPVSHRPEIRRIQYASPGYIDLILMLKPALEVATSVAAIIAVPAAILKTYRAIQDHLKDIRLAKSKEELEVIKIEAEKIKAIRELTEDLAELTKLKNLEDLQNRAPNDLVAANLVLARYRRLKILADYAESEKVTLPPEKSSGKK